MTLDLTAANLLTTPGATGGASAQPGTAPGAGTAAAGNAQTVASPFALMVDVPPVTPVAAIAPAGTKRNVQVQDAIDPASPGDASTLALATSDGRPAQATAVEGAQTQPAPSSPAATPAPADTSLPGAKATETAKPVSEGIPADKSVSTPKPVSEVIAGEKAVVAPKPVSEPLQGPPVPVTTGASTVAANGQATLPASAGSATDMATNVTANAALQPAAVAKPLAQQGKADTAADTGPGKSTAATGKTAAATSPSATNPAPATQPSAASPAMDAGRVLGDGADASALRQQPSPHSAIQTASSLAARPAANPAGSAAPSASATPTAGTATTSAASSAATAATSDPAAALAAGKAAAPTTAQAGAPITALPGAMGDLQAQHQAASQEAADADLAAQAENDLSLARVDGRLAADRSGATPQRFTPHTTAQLAGQITKHVSNGNRVFDIRLDPAELGKVDVRIELRADNRVHAVLTVERAETLNELQRSARDLERSLAEAGLELGENGLSFQMSDGQNPAEDDRRSQGEALPIFTQTTEMTQRAEDELASRPRSAYGFLLSGRSGVDLQV